MRFLRYCGMAAALAVMLSFGGCAPFVQGADHAASESAAREEEAAVFTEDSRISDVMRTEVFAPYGRLLFPVQRGYMDGDTLASQAVAGKQIFYPIYTEEEMRRDPAKRDTGLFFFRGRAGAPVAICNAGGGFAYVGAMQDSFPHALALSKKGYHAFALIYRPGAQTACEDLARAIAFVHEHAAELGVDAAGYALWGGSAGVRMAAWFVSFGTEAFGERPYPRPAAVILQYMGLSEVYGNEPPTYSCVGTADGIASWRTMQRRTEAIEWNGQAAQIEIFPGLPHGFGLGEGTGAEGWLDCATDFWEEHRR